MAYAPIVCGETPAPDPAAKLTLFAAAFAKDAPPPSAARVTAMAFLPGRGVVSWDITGKTPTEAREAQIEAMGLADARAVQREIDTAQAEKRAELDREATQRESLTPGAGVGRTALDMPATPRSPRDVAFAVPLSRIARSGGFPTMRNGDALRDQGRLYAFAAASGRGVGLNALHGEAGWKNGGMTTDQGGFTGQRQAGLAWRKGVVQTSVSYVQEKDRTQILGIQSNKDRRLMLTMNVQPHALLGLFKPGH